MEFQITKFSKRINNEIQCLLCPHNCLIKENKTGICGVRKNIAGQLNLITYGVVSTIAIDPIEKKPLYHFFPGKNILSIGGFGCNLCCKGCQNYEISKEFNLDFPYHYNISPEMIIKECKEKKLDMIAFTYNEPTISYEFVYDTFKLAKKSRIKTVLVTNGYINTEPIKDLAKYVDAVNIDLKAFDEKTYIANFGGSLLPVLEALKEYKKQKVWIEITNLLIPKVNDDLMLVEDMSRWIKENLGKEVPLHFSRFYPMYRMADLKATDEKLLLNAKKIADKYLDHVYIGNISEEEYNSTFCPDCQKKIVSRIGYHVDNLLNKNKCPFCNHEIRGVFE